MNGPWGDALDTENAWTFSTLQGSLRDRHELDLLLDDAATGIAALAAQ
jgi:hypothetical protein